MVEENDDEECALLSAPQLTRIPRENATYRNRLNDHGLSLRTETGQFEARIHAADLKFFLK